MKYYFVLWYNYDGNKVDRFLDNEKEKAEDFIATIKQKEELQDYGTELSYVILGEEVKVETVEVTKKVVIKDE